MRHRDVIESMFAPHKQVYFKRHRVGNCHQPCNEIILDCPCDDACLIRRATLPSVRLPQCRFLYRSRRPDKALC